MSPTLLPLAFALAGDPRWRWLTPLMVRFRERPTEDNPHPRWMFATLLGTGSPRLDVTRDDDDTVLDVSQNGLVFSLGGIEGELDPKDPNRRASPRTEILRFLDEEIEIAPELDFVGTLGALLSLASAGTTRLRRVVLPPEKEGGRPIVRWSTETEAGPWIAGEGPVDGIALSWLICKRWGVEVDLSTWSERR